MLEGTIIIPDRGIVTIPDKEYNLVSSRESASYDMASSYLLYCTDGPTEWGGAY